MKPHQTNSNRLGTLAAVILSAAVLGFGTAALSQSSYTWNGGGGDNNFGTSANWSGNSAPGSLQSYLNFSGSTRPTPNNNYGDYSGGYQIYLNSGATVPFTITGNHIKFYNYGGGGGNYGPSPNIENDSTSLFTLNFGFGSESSGNNMNITASAGNMAFGTTSGNAFSYFDDAGVYLAVHANNSHTVTFNGAIGNGSQNAKFSLDGGGVCIFNAVNTYTGESDINAGELQITANGGISSSSAIYLGNGGTTASDQITLTGNGGQTFANGFTINNVNGGSDHTKRIIASSNTSGSDTYSGTITLDSDVSLNAENSGGGLVFSGEVGVNAFTAYATGPGTVTLNGNNVDNVNLGLVVNSGTVVLDKTGTGHAVGTGLTINSGGTAQLGSGGNGDQIYDSAPNGVTVNSGGAFDLNGQTETIPNISLNGTGIGGAGALTNSSASAATLTLNGASTLAGAASIGGNGNITITGSGNLSAGSITYMTKVGANTITLANGSGLDNLNVHVIVNSGTVILAKTNTSSGITGSSSVHATGQVTIESGATVQLGGSGGYEIYDGQNSTNLSGGVLDLNGQNQSFNGSGNLTINGTGIGSGGALINSSTGTTSTIGGTATNVAGMVVLGSSSSVGGSGNLTIAGVIGDNGNGYSLTKVGSGTLTLSSNNTYSGSTTISAGTLALGANGVLSSNTTVNLAGGTLAMGSYNNTVHALQSSGSVLARGTWGSSSSTANHISAAMTGTGILTVSTGGSSTSVVTSSANPSTYGNSVTFTNTVTGSGGDGSTPSGTVTFYDGATSIGTGTLSGSGTVATATLTISNLTVTTHNITASYGGNASYDVSTSSAVSQGVNPKAVTITGVTAASRAYNGTTTAALSGGTVSGTFNSDNVTFTAGTGAFASEYVGTWAVTASGYALSLSGISTNYSLSAQPTVPSASISALPVTLSGSRAYDGTATAQAMILTIVDNLDGANLTLSGSATLAGSAYGSQAITDFSGLMLGGSSATNYTLAGASGSVTITQAGSYLSLTSSSQTNGYLASVSFTAAVQTNGVTAGDATGSVTFTTNGTALCTSGLTGGIANSVTITNLPRGTNVITAEYSGDVNYSGYTNTLNQIVTNHPPVASVMTVMGTAGLNLQIVLTDLATNWSDVDGDTVELIAVSATTTNNATVFPVNWTTNGDGSITITNNAYIGLTNIANVNDQFSYTIIDGQGGTNTGLVNIVVNSSITGTNSITSIQSGYPTTLTAQGIPSFSYITERSTNLVNWVDISTNTAATNGVITVQDYFIDLGGHEPASAFYRLMWQ